MGREQNNSFCQQSTMDKSLLTCVVSTIIFYGNKQWLRIEQSE